jgi:hypothetical protein
MVRKLPAYMTEILLEKGVKWNKQTNKLHSPLASQCVVTYNLKVAKHLKQAWYHHLPSNYEYVYFPVWYNVLGYPSGICEHVQIHLVFSNSCLDIQFDKYLQYCRFSHLTPQIYRTECQKQLCRFENTEGGNKDWECIVVKYITLLALFI